MSALAKNTPITTFQITLSDHEGNHQVYRLDLKKEATPGPCEPLRKLRGRVLRTETAVVDITAQAPDCLKLRLDGNAWRDLECSDTLNDFLRQALHHQVDPQDYLNSLAASLDVNGEPGQVL